MDPTDDVYFDETSCSVRAHAKLNITLEVLRKRDDGFHDVINIMQTIDLHDTICLSLSEDDQIRFESTSPDIDESDNLAVRAATLLKQRFAVETGVRIELCKRIPIAAGLGGGSSDAAAVLLALSRLWRLSIARSDIVDLAARLGSDVPFFLSGGLAVCEGRGERVTTLPEFWPSSMRWLLLVKPSVGVSTADAYSGLSPSSYSDGSCSRAVCRSLEQGKGFDLGAIKNTMAASVFQRYPEIADVRENLLAAGAVFVELCGSGSTLFSPFDRLDTALRVRERFASRYARSTMYLTQACMPR